MSREVIVTGVGIVSPAGTSADATWQALLSGARCIQSVPELSVRLGASALAGRVSGFTVPVGFESRDRVCQMAVAAAIQAVGQDVPRFVASLGSLRLGISIGTSKGGIQQFGQFASAFSRLRTRFSLAELPEATDVPPDSAARAVSELLGVPSCVHATVGACTTGTLAVIRGAQMIEDGDVDIVLCGGADASLHPLWFAAFEQMGVLASAHPELGPAYACQPFDRNRRGFAMGEGAGVLLLESEQAVKHRRRQPFARLVGHAVCTDPAGLTQLTESGEILAHTIRLACQRAGIEARDIACIHAHGTGTTPNDLAESRGFTNVLGKNVGAAPIVSAKGAIGHLLGAAGAVELALAALACRDRRCFGNSALLDPDKDMSNLNLPSHKVELTAGPILKTAMGFGGHVAAVVIAE